ncbi:MAG: aminotransferase class III-fold pyridoxal phosphate-dependent enzyme, partial [Chloroflexi bacterium]|nr:aminotransferase class III-fold pyridoxal phosphate-dependent enzyme [Chloroflexota bacterium]
SGNPLVCAAAKVVTEKVLEPAFLDSVNSKGDALRQALESLRSTGKVVDIRGMGLLLGFQLDSVETADALIAGARDNGLLIIKVSADTVRMVPPLTVSESEIDAAAGIIRNVLLSL